VVDHIQFRNRNVHWNIYFSITYGTQILFFELLYSNRVSKEERMEFVGSPPKGESLN
jgi:hypothetical protein